MTRTQRHGNRFAYAGVFVGLSASVAANIAHCFVSATPETGEIISAVFWPVALLLTTEILIRKVWPEGTLWILLRLVGLAPVALVAGIISYGHLHSLLLHYHESALGALIGPLAVDGMMLISSAALLAPERKVNSKPAKDVAAEIDKLVLAGRAVIAEIEQSGRKVSKTALVKGIRARGHSISDQKAATLLARLQAA